MRVIKGVYQLSRLCRHLVTLHHFNAVMHEYKKIFINIFIVEIVKQARLLPAKNHFNQIKYGKKAPWRRGVIDGNRLCQIPSIIKRLLLFVMHEMDCINSEKKICGTAFGFLMKFKFILFESQLKSRSDSTINLSMYVLQSVY